MEMDSNESADDGDGGDDGNDADVCCKDGAYDDGDGKSLYSHHMYGSEDAGDDSDDCDDDADAADDNGNDDGLCRSVLSISKYCEQNTSHANFCTAAAASSSRPQLSFVSTHDDTSASSSRIHMFTG